MDWMVGTDQLDAIQRRTVETVVRSSHKNHLIKGFAGTGKTIVVTHVLKRLASRRDLRVCFATYTFALKEMVESGLTIRERSSITSTTFDGFSQVHDDFDVIVADEMQDIDERRLKILLARSKKLICSADHMQTIYRKSLPESGFRALLSPLQTYELRTIHRLNRPVFDVATSIIERHCNTRPKYGKLPLDDREPVRVAKTASRRQESSMVVDEAERLSRIRYPSAILVPSHSQISHLLNDISRLRSWGPIPPETGDRYNPYAKTNEFLLRKGSVIEIFGSKSGKLESSAHRRVVYLMTYHSAKGLEFQNVFLPYLKDGNLTSPIVGATAKELAETFFVAATRAKERLYLSYHGSNPHIYIKTVLALPPSKVRPLALRKWS